LRNAQELQAEWSRSLANCDLLVDAVLGTGFHPPVKGFYADAIAAMNESGKPVVAVDIPSGADSDSMSAQADKHIARADAIVTFTAPRPAHVFGNLTRGPIVVAPIGSPPEAIVSQLALELTTPRDFAALLAPRPADSNKGMYGHVLIVGGSLGKSGAAAMAGMAALRAGAGLSPVATPPGGVGGGRRMGGRVDDRAAGRNRKRRHRTGRHREWPFPEAGEADERGGSRSGH